MKIWVSPSQRFLKKFFFSPFCWILFIIGLKRNHDISSSNLKMVQLSNGEKESYKYLALITWFKRKSLFWFNTEILHISLYQYVSNQQYASHHRCSGAMWKRRKVCFHLLEFEQRCTRDLRAETAQPGKLNEKLFSVPPGRTVPRLYYTPGDKDSRSRAYVRRILKRT